MRRPLSVSALWLAGCLLAGPGCKDRESAEAESRAQTVRQLISDGRRMMSNGQAEQAAAAFRQASSLAPNDPAPVLLQAAAEREAGNEGAAILALKQASQLTRFADPVMKKQMAELYLGQNEEKAAVAVLVQLRDDGQLSDSELLSLARMQGRVGDIEGGYQTLERIQRVRPDDEDAKVAEAELLMISGEEQRALKIIERLLAANPKLVSAHVLRARFLLNEGDAEGTLGELANLDPEGAKDTDAIELRARALNQLKRYDEAETALTALLEKSPRDVTLIALLAEVKLNLGQVTEAEALVDRALGIQPRFARAIYVRGRTLEAENDQRAAEDAYKQALRLSPGFAPALSRMWRLDVADGAKADAVTVLERLLFLNEASTDERATLADLYADLKLNPSRARRLIDEALRRDPKNPRYKAIKARLPGRGEEPSSSRGERRSSGPEIIRIR